MSTAKTATIALIAGLAGVQIAAAADLPRRTDPYAPAPVYAAPISNWQGFYAGVHLGGGFGSSGPIDTSGFVGGLQGGYNFQFDKIVVGAEADITYSGIGNSSFQEKSDINWLGSIRGRAGYSFGNILPYVTAGWGFGDTKYSNIYGQTKDTASGWVLGAGAEMMVMPNITVRAEYLYYDLGSQDYPTAAGLGRIDTTTNVIRGGVNYKF